MNYVPSSHEVETFTGKYVDTKRPDPVDICIEDIAHALSQICRYGGHCAHRYTVAQHSIFVVERLRRRGVGKKIQLAGLLHDASEAYLGDIPRPMKGLLGRSYTILTDRMDAAIHEALDLPFPVTWFHAPEVKDADNWSLFVEAKHLLPSQGINWAGSQLEDWGVRQDGLPTRIVTPPYWRGREVEEDVESEFLTLYHDLGGPTS